MGATQMKKHITAGPTGLTRIRSLVAFRHHNPVARFVSTLLAFAIAMLLAVGPSAAYADGTAPSEPTATDTSAPADTTSADTSTTDTTGTDTSTSPDTTTTPDPSTTTDPAPSTTASSTGSSSTLSKTLRNVVVTPSLVGNAACQIGGNTMVGGFEIDGDPCDDEGGIDFNNGPGDSVDDPFQSKTDSSFTGGSSENQDPSMWALNGPQPTGKADIGTVWGYSASVNGTVYAYFGFTNDSTSGGTEAASH
jgi:hypothetical protein